MTKWARCNFDGKPIHPGDQKVIEAFMKLLKQNATFTGTLEYQPELRYTPSGYAIVNFGLFTLPDLRLMRCEAWNELAESIIERDLQTGTKIEVIGSVKTRKWEDREMTMREYEYISVTAIGL